MAAESSFITLTLPEVDSGMGDGKVVVIAQAPADRWIRVQARNISFGAGCRISDSESALALFPNDSNTYFLPAGACDVFVLCPGQRLFASSASETAKLCLAISWALPSDVSPARLLSL